MVTLAIAPPELAPDIERRSRLIPRTACCSTMTMSTRWATWCGRCRSRCRR